MTDKTCADRIDATLASRVEDLRAFMTGEPTKEMQEEYDRYGDGDIADFVRERFYEYGLSMDYVEADTFDDQPTGYYRYQLSWGGPSDEIRFQPNGTITYHFHDWFDGALRQVTNEDWAQWLVSDFEDMGMIDWESVDYGNK